MSRIAQRRVFHKAYPVAIRFWPPVRRVLEEVADRYPATDRPLASARAAAKRALGFEASSLAPQRLPLRHQPVPPWLAWEWREAREIEPDVLPVGLHMERVGSYHYEFESPVIDAYERLCAMTPPGTTHILLVPWLLTGGADLEALNYVRALHQSDKVGRILVIATRDVESVWASRLPEGVAFVDFGRLFVDLTWEEQEYLLATFLVQAQPKVIHNVNSDLGYRVLARHARALRATHIRLFVSVFCFDYTPDGLFDGYQVRYLRDIAPHLDGIFCDNARHLAELRALYALEPDKLHVHLQPMELDERPRPPAGADHGRLRVLWAGRLDRQKRPDLLLEIARRAAHLPLDIDVYGDSVLDAMGSLKTQMQAVPNVRYRGGFDGLRSIPVPLYDVLLYTSQWDGMPNMLLEATAHGLPLIASDVGGISEFVRDGETGWLVAPYDDVSGYVARLTEACRRPGRLAELQAGARQALLERHTFESFVLQLEHVEGYLE